MSLMFLSFVPLTHSSTLFSHSISLPLPFSVSSSFTPKHFLEQTVSIHTILAQSFSAILQLHNSLLHVCFLPINSYTSLLLYSYTLKHTAILRNLIYYPSPSQVPSLTIYVSQPNYSQEILLNITTYQVVFKHT